MKEGEKDGGTEIELTSERVTSWPWRAAVSSLSEAISRFFSCVGSESVSLHVLPSKHTHSC